MTQPAGQSQIALAEAARQVQIRLRAQLLLQVTQAWPMLDPQRLDKTWPTWLRLMVALLTRYHAQSAIAASAHYRAARQAAIGSASAVQLAPTLDPQWLTRALGYAAPGTYARVEGPQAQISKAALSNTLGTASRLMLDGQRTTVINTATADPDAIGWYRVTDPDPCAFCALLASRPVIGGKGAFYKTKETAEFRAHNHCACSAAPYFSHGQPLPALAEQAADVYRNRGKGPALKAFRAAWAERTAA